MQGSHKASTRDAEMVQETVKGTVWGKVIDRKVKKDIKILTILQVIHLCGNRFDFNLSYFCWLVRVSLFIELGGAGDLGTRKRGAFSTFMISRPILHGSDWWKF